MTPLRNPQGQIIGFEPPTPHESGKTLVLEFVLDCGLGNQCFELAAAYGIAKTLGLPLRWAWKPSRKREFDLKAFGFAENPPPRYKLVMSRVGQGHRKFVDLAVKRVTESEDLFPAISCPFQDEQCFVDNADDIRELFQIEPFELKIPAGATAIGVQVRRGDYIGHKRLNVVTPDYFRNAMDWMRERHPRAHFFIVSDDPGWCKRQFETQLDVTVMPPQSAIDGLRTLASCDSHVISNSTFGWWGAWLGENGPVVVPEMWHHKPGSYGDWQPVPERWHRVSIGPAKPSADSLVPGTRVKKTKRAIVYPWHASQAKWHELRYSLRSIEKHFEDKDCPIYILGTRRPEWMVEHPRVKYIGAWTYQLALSKGLEVADTVMWMNDDIVLLKDVGWKEVSVPRYVREIDIADAVTAPEQAIPWRESCRKVLVQLIKDGVTDLKLFSTHTPYVYDREKALEVLRRFGTAEKLPLELAYFNLHPEGATEIGGDRVHGLPLDRATYLNYADQHLTAGLKEELRRRFPDFAPWELKLAFNG
jgi:Glycosyl transferase family 11